MLARCILIKPWLYFRLCLLSGDCIACKYSVKQEQDTNMQQLFKSFMLSIMLAVISVGA